LEKRSFEIVLGARRYTTAQLAEVDTVPVRIKNMTDAGVLEAASMCQALRTFFSYAEVRGWCRAGIPLGIRSQRISKLCLGI